MKSMKKLLLLLASPGLCGAAYAQDPKWVQTDVALNGTHIYLDVAKISNKGRLTGFWAKRTNEPGVAYDSIVAHMYTDCTSRETVQVVSQTTYNKAGEQVTGSEEPFTMSVTDGSIMTRLVDSACNITTSK